VLCPPVLCALLPFSAVVCPALSGVGAVLELHGFPNNAMHADAALRPLTWARSTRFSPAVGPADRHDAAPVMASVRALFGRPIAMYRAQNYLCQDRQEGLRVLGLADGARVPRLARVARG
jgi:hypothetical protein